MASDPYRGKFCNKDAFGCEHREPLFYILQESCKSPARTLQESRKNRNNITVTDFAFVSTQKPGRIK